MRHEAPQSMAREDRGSTQVEEVVVVGMVAVGFAAATVPLGELLLAYHAGIEWVLALPLP